MRYCGVVCRLDCAILRPEMDWPSVRLGRAPATVNDPCDTSKNYSHFVDILCRYAQLPAAQPLSAASICKDNSVCEGERTRRIFCPRARDAPSPLLPPAITAGDCLMPLSSAAVSYVSCGTTSSATLNSGNEITCNTAISLTNDNFRYPPYRHCETSWLTSSGGCTQWWDSAGSR